MLFQPESAGERAVSRGFAQLAVQPAAQISVQSAAQLAVQSPAKRCVRCSKRNKKKTEMLNDSFVRLDNSIP